MIAVVVTLCSLAMPQSCRDEILPIEVPMQACMMGVPQLAEWMRDRPGERLAKWRCFIGRKANGI